MTGEISRRLWRKFERWSKTNRKKNYIPRKALNVT